uniref:Uncharacterized protein n=1 Tax=Knipowitschia caucasica TaxID=637954 RepID=A0AAV2K5K4_KNICA
MQASGCYIDFVTLFRGYGTARRYTNTEDSHPESLYPTPAVFTKATVEFNFSAAPLHSDPSTFVLLLHNPGCIPVEWSFLFPQDQQLELEFWAMTGEFTSTELYQMKVQDNHLFSISPRSGRLMPGQQRAVTFTYSHDFIAIDRFPVLLKISYGREIMLIFQGTTIEVDRPYLHYSSNTHIFNAVATGDYYPPKQMYQLYNQGAVPVKYEVDKAAFSKIQEENFNHPVLRCLNPRGEIPPGEAAILEWVFSPLEATLYQMDIPIHVQNGESTTVRFEGCGIYSLTPKVSNRSDNTDVPLVPCWQRAPFPERPAFLSEDSVHFGKLVVSSKTTRMLFLNNAHTDTVLFEWVLPQHSSQPQVMTIVPSRGRLLPGGTAHFVLTLFSSKYPTNYQFDAICKITGEAALCDYINALRHIEEEKERLKNEFIITDKIPKENKMVLTEKEAESVALRQQAFLNKYKTLPPIRGTNDCNTVRSLSSKVSRAERRALRELSKVEKGPEPPKPSLLHLWVTAQSHSHEAFQKSLDQRRYLVDDTHKLQETRHSHKPESSDQFKVNAESQDSPGEEEKPVRAELLDLMEEVCQATLQNLMIEAIRGELDLTASSQTLVLPTSTRNTAAPINLDDDGTGSMDKDN